MGRWKKVFERVMSGRADANIRFDDLRGLLRALAFDETIRGSHHLFRRDGVRELVNLQRDGAVAKVYQVRQVRTILLRYRFESPGEWAMRSFRYELVVSWSVEDSLFIVEVPELPGCSAHGRTPTEAVAHAQDAIALWIDVARAAGRPIPEPKDRRSLPA
jgi:predicted RNase H-like HicB family nuclease